MCGIVAYAGPRLAMPIALQGVKRLEYRGYDSWGIFGISEPGKFQMCKEVAFGRDFSFFQDQVEKLDWSTVFTAIGHNRWATNGEPSQKNAHPHLDCTGKIAVAHNGIIENYRELKTFLQKRGHTIVSDTDTELIAHLVEEYMKSGSDIQEVVLQASRELQGAFAFVLLHADYPSLMIGVRFGSPLVCASLDDGSHFIASSPLAFIAYTKTFFDLADRQIAFVENGKMDVVSFEGEAQITHPEVFEGSLEELEHEGFPHFMLKEIHEQMPKLADCMAGRVQRGFPNVRLGGISDFLPLLLEADEVFFIGSGTSFRAGLIGEWMFKNFLHIRARALQASEVMSHDFLAGCDPTRTVCFCISQSGETRDLIIAIEEMQRRGVSCFGIVNAVGSKVARITKKGVYLRVGPEIGVASTKAYTATILVEAMLALLLAREKNIISHDDAVRFADAICDIPAAVSAALDQEPTILEVAKQIYRSGSLMVLGRGYHYATALEGALKMEEVAVIAALCELAGEMKHGPIAMMRDKYPVIVVAPDDPQRANIFTNIDEIKARGAYVIGICNPHDTEMIEHVHTPIIIPAMPPYLATIPAAVVMQLLAYHLGVLRGVNVDKPPNLAKSVTVS